MRPRLRVGSTDIGIAYNVADERSVPLGRLNETIGNMVRAVPKVIGDDVRQVPELGRALVAVGLFSALINVLYLTGSFYMMQVYDRAIPSRNIPTLVALSVLALILYVGQCAIDLSRQRVLSRMARLVDERLSPRVFRLLSRLPLTSGGAAIGLQPVRDLDQIRNFLAGGGPLGFLDLPWMPFYLGICFLFHPAIGVAALAGAVILLCLTIITQVMTRKSIDVATQLGGARMSLGESSRRNAEVVAAMGMGERLSPIWDKLNQMYLDANQRGNDVAGGLGGVSRVARMALQSGVLGLGAYLVIQGEASAGVIFAASISVSARSCAGRTRDRELEGIPPQPVRAGRDCATTSHRARSRTPHCRFQCPGQRCRLKASASCLLAVSVQLFGMSRSAWRRVALLASSVRVRPASHPWRGHSWARGAPSGAWFAWTGLRSTNGLRRRSAAPSGIFPRTSSCSKVRWHKIYRASSKTLIPRPLSGPRSKRACTRWSSSCRTAMKHGSARAGQRFRVGRSSVSPSLGHCTATRSWLCSMSPIPTSTQRESRLSLVQ